MTVLAVTFDGTRLNDSDANTNWGNFVIGGGAPASEFPLAYQVTSGTTTGAVNKKINSTTARQGVDYVHGSGTDMTAAANKLWFCKIYVSDSFDLNATWGVEVAMGSSDTNNDHRYNIAGTGANLSSYNTYPAQGGYLITSIDPNIDAWRESENGTLNQASVLWFAVGAQFINGTAKTENVAMDSIDIGTGLTIVSGTGADPAGTFPDFVAEDQDDKTNRWGVVTGAGNNVTCNGLLTIGSATATDFQDSTSVIRYPDGYHSRGLVGVIVALSNASTIVVDGSLHLGEGTRNGVDANDTRPDYTVTGTTATTSEFTHTLRNFRDVTYTSVCDVHDADITCHLLVQNSADIYDSVIRTNALTSIACLQDPTFGTTTDLHDVDFVQVGAGHAIEIDTAGSYTFKNLSFTGYGATTSDSAALDVTAGTGTVTITLDGTAEPTYKTAGASVVFVSAVTFQLTNVVSGTELHVHAKFTTDTPAGAYNGTGDSVIQMTAAIGNSLPSSGNCRLWNGTYYEVYAYTGVSGQQLTGVTPTLSQDFDGVVALIEDFVAPTNITTDPWSTSLKSNQDFVALLANASGATKYQPVQFEDNTGSGFARRIEQIED